MKLIEKIRINGKVKKRYQIDTPLNRVLNLPHTQHKIKTPLLNTRNTIDILELTKTIEHLREKNKKTPGKNIISKDLFLRKYVLQLWMQNLKYQGLPSNN